MTKVVGVQVPPPAPLFVWEHPEHNDIQHGDDGTIMNTSTLQVSETRSDGLEREFSISVDAEFMQSKIDEKLESLQQTANIKGFRKGKVPKSLLLRRYGNDIVKETVGETIEDSVDRVVKERELNPAVAPRLSDYSFAVGESLQFDLTVELVPAFDSPDWSEWEFKTIVPETDDILALALEECRRALMTFDDAPAEHAIQVGDCVTFDVLWEPADSTDENDNTDRRRHVIVIRAADDEIAPDFLETFDVVIGRNTGETVPVEKTRRMVMEDSQYDGPLPVSMTINKIEIPTDLTVSELLQIRGDETGLVISEEELKEMLKTNLQTYVDLRNWNMRKQALLDRFATTVSFEVPKSLVTNEARAISANLGTLARTDDDGDDKDVVEADDIVETEDVPVVEAGATEADGAEYAEDSDSTDDLDDQEIHEIAERRVRLAFLMRKIAFENDIQVSAATLQDLVIRQARLFPGREAAVIKYYQENNAALQSLTAPALEDAVIEHVLATARSNALTCSLREFLAGDHADVDGTDGDETTEPEREFPPDVQENVVLQEEGLPLYLLRATWSQILEKENEARA